MVVKPKSYISAITESKETIVINKSVINDTSTSTEESKTPKVKPIKDSKFLKRFSNRLPKNSGKIEDAGEFQWVHKPT